MDLLDRINSLTDDQLRMVAERDDASGVLASYRLSELRGLPYPDRSVVVLADDYAIVAQDGSMRRVEIDRDTRKIIRQEGGNYCVYSEDGERSFGCYPSMEEAEERLRQIHYFDIEHKADGVSVGDHVLYAVPKPPGPTTYAHGVVDRIERDGAVTLPGTDETVEASPDDPVAVITVWADTEAGYRETDRRVARPVSSLRVSEEPLEKASDKVMETLREKAREHNDEVGDAKSKRTTARTLAAVFDRGVGAYRGNPGSVRPSVSSAEQWAYARVNGFLYALKNGRFKRSPFDTDLLPEGHPLSTKSVEKQRTKLEDGEDFPPDAFAYVPDPERPSTWKLRLWGSLEEKETRRQVGAAIAALGPEGFRGNRVEIPAEDLPAVRARVLAAWRDVWGDEAEDVPGVLLEKRSFAPPKGVQEAAARALEWIKDGHAGSGFTDVGRARAAQLARGDNVSRETIGRMASFFGRHSVNRGKAGWNRGDDGFPSPGRVAWDAWGGDPGRTWAESIMRRDEKQACPPATQDVEVNLANRQEAIDVAMYGPLNPNEPSEDYWERLAGVWDVEPDDARKSVCGNCAAFDVTSSMRDCVAEGLDGDSQDPYDVIDAGDIGYCRAFKFKCAAARTCSAWIAGGPIDDSAAPVEDARPLSKAAFLKRAEEKRFTLGPLYVPDFMDAHGEWTDADELQAGVWHWVRSGDRRIFLQHDTDVEAGEWVEVMTMPQPWTVDMVDSSGEPIGEVTYPPNTVFLGVVWNEDAWEMVKAGELRGYSIGGYSDRVLADLPENGERDGLEIDPEPPQDLAKAIAAAVSSAMRDTSPTVNVVMSEERKARVRRIERDEHGNIARIIEEED